jgi:3-hydroxyisobutyrate dehydrogenase-like beta-hydroxyacid dehydrogenase
MQSFIDDGVPGAADAVSAVAASQVILICIDNYESSNLMLQNEKVSPLLAGRTVVQLSRGTPKEAVDTAEWMREHNVTFLDGAILGGPNGIGTDDAHILLCGDEAAFEKAGRLLACLAGTVRYLGTNVKAASALDLAWLNIWYGQFVAVAHAASVCKSEGVGLDDLMSTFPDQPYAQKLTQIIREESFDKSTATLEVWDGALKRIQQQGRDANINTEFPDFVASLFKKAMSAGFGQENVMSLFKILQDNHK